MRVIHLCFGLQIPVEVKKQSAEASLAHYFVDAATFKKWNQDVYQPLLALLERNTQKHAKFNFSLLISGPWWDLAEKYDVELVERVKRLIKLGRVELLATPYYQSLAGFYNLTELTEQVRYFQEQADRRFGVKGRILALPELTYQDELGRWAEDYGLAGVLVGGAERVLDWRSPYHVYEAAECKYLRLLFADSGLARRVAQADESLLVEKKLPDSEDKRPQLAVAPFRKLVDLANLRGGLLNLYFDAEVFRTARSAGIVGFFDELIADWLETKGNYFVGAAQACVAETPKIAVRVHNTVSLRGGAKSPAPAPPLALAKIEPLPPDWLSQGLAGTAEKSLYALYKEILASADDQLMADFRKLTPVSYALNMTNDGLEIWQQILDDLHQKAETIKKAQAVEISKAYTKRHERDVPPTETQDESAEVKINFTKSTPAKKTKQPPLDVQSETLPSTSEHNEEVVDDLNAVLEELAEPVEVKMKKKSPKHAMRKVIRKLVIE